MVDLASLTEGLALLKSGTEGVRAAFGLWRDVKGLVPQERREEVTRALEQSEKQFQIAEAQIAMGLGYALCRCVFPPTPMLTIGWHEQQRTAPACAVHQCPRCGAIDAKGGDWIPTSTLREQTRAYLHHAAASAPSAPV